jgi:hypothetical protein
MPFISLTRLRIRSWRFMPAFVWYAFRSSRQAQRAEGFLDGKLVVDARNTFWTVTAWSSEAAMRAYRAQGPHLGAMSKLAHWCDEASVVHWEQEGIALPSPGQLHRRMVESGRPSRVDHPSADQSANRIAPPRVRTQTPLPRKRAAIGQTAL